MTMFFNDLFKSLGINTNVTREQSLAAIRSIDQNFDGGIDKKELFDAFKALMNRPQVPQMNNNPGNYGGGYGYGYSNKFLI